MKLIQHLIPAPNPNPYRIAGQRKEQNYRYTATGKVIKADNTPFMAGGDIGSIQIKSARATICKGTDLTAHLAADPATHYVYVMADEVTAVLMDKQTYCEMCERFGIIDRESKSNGGAVKLRLGHETRQMVRWLLNE